MALGEILGPGPKTEKNIFTVPGVPKRKKSYYAIRDGCLQLFYILRFGRLDPQGRKITKYRYFQAILAYDGPGHLKKSQARAENGKPQFTGARGPEMEEKKVTTLSRMVVRNLFTFYGLADETPTGGKSQNTGILGHFGRGRPLAFREIPGLCQKRKNAISRC